MSRFETLVRHFTAARCPRTSWDRCSKMAWQCPLTSLLFFHGLRRQELSSPPSITDFWSKQHVIYNLLGKILNIALYTQGHLLNFCPALRHALGQRSFDVKLVLGSLASPLRFKRDLCRLLGAWVLLGETMLKRAKVIRVQSFEDVVVQPQLGPYLLEF